MKVTMCECCGALCKALGGNEKRITLHGSSNMHEDMELDLCPDCYNEILEMIESKKRIYQPEKTLYDFIVDKPENS